MSIIGPTNRRNPVQACSGVIELARIDLVPGQLSPDRAAAKVPLLSRQPVSGGVSDRIGPSVQALAVAADVSRRLMYSLLQNAEGKRPLFGGTNRCQDDPYWRNHV